MNGTKFLTFAIALNIIAAHLGSLKLITCRNFRFAIFKKLSTIEVVFVIPDLCLCTVYWIAFFFSSSSRFFNIG
jgi:hypothetical protein